MALTVTACITVATEIINEVAIGPVTGRDSHSYRSDTQQFFREGCTGKAMIRR